MSFFFHVLKNIFSWMDVFLETLVFVPSGFLMTDEKGNMRFSILIHLILHFTSNNNVPVKWQLLQCVFCYFLSLGHARCRQEGYKRHFLLMLHYPFCWHLDATQRNTEECLSFVNGVEEGFCLFCHDSLRQGRYLPHRAISKPHFTSQWDRP